MRNYRVSQRKFQQIFLCCRQGSGAAAGNNYLRLVVRNKTFSQPTLLQFAAIENCLERLAALNLSGVNLQVEV